jgi:hypothetical protein
MRQEKQEAKSQRRMQRKLEKSVAGPDAESEFSLSGETDTSGETETSSEALSPADMQPGESNPENQDLNGR